MTDDQYYRRRAEQERARAAAAERPEVRAAHLQLASLYTERLVSGERPMLQLVA